MDTQNESGLPTSNNSNRKSSDLLPRFFRTDANKKFLSATLDQLTQPGTVKKLSGFVGRRNAKASTANDVYISASDSDRQNYQLEPVAVIKDELDNVNFYKDYIDHINHIETQGGVVNNHARLNKEEFYSWNPHINWDKFVNFQQYYWLPYGPTPIEIQGQQQAIESTYTVSVVDEDDNYAFLFTPDGLTRNPILTLYRGQTYNFVIDSPNNPFTIKTRRVAGSLDKYVDGVSASSVTNGIITFTVLSNAPDVLYYVSEADANTGGAFEIKDIDENSFLDVGADVLGKKTYTLSNGIALANGMKVSFAGRVTPEIYNEGYWYVEGVGTAIKLVNEDDLEIISGYTEERALLFDDEPFDKSPFSTLTSFPKEKDYVVINRSSIDRNQWSRYNRWFHQDVILAAAQAQNVVPEFDQTQRAIRPIIEFDEGLKLFNFGHKAKKNVDVIDTFTTDVFSTIEGTLGYNIDGIPLTDGMRVLFTADTDRYVNGKIFKVNFITITLPGRQIDFNAFSSIDIVNDVITFDQEHGLVTGNQVTYLINGNETIEGLDNRQVYYVSVVDSKKIRLFADKNFANKIDIFAVGTGIHKLEVFAGLRRQINLVEDEDTVPLEYETVLIKLGATNQGRMFWYNGSKWTLGQYKQYTNQPPLFDIFDENEKSYSDISVYDGSSFQGSKIFSYKIGTGAVDTELKFPLSYQNINNTGDIVFEFNLLADSFSYKIAAQRLFKNTNVGYLRKIFDLNRFEYVNGWTKSFIENSQGIVRVFKEESRVLPNGSTELVLNDFPIDVFDFKEQLIDLEVKAYVNGVRKNKNTFVVLDGPIRKYVKFIDGDISPSDVVTLKCYANQPKNQNGYYEIPISLQNNPQNNNILEFTLGQVIDHVNSIVENLPGFEGVFPGNNNIRNLGNITPYGTRFVQHTGPLNFSLYHLGSKVGNAFKALSAATNDYGKFKRAFITFASESGIDTDPKRHVDFILETLFKDKTKTQTYYLSDMFGYSGGKRIEYIVLDPRVKSYPLSAPFNLNTLSNKAVNIYLNGNQLLHGRDYEFSDDVFFTISDSVTLTEDDIIETFEYESTDGAYCPATPTKLGLYPLYEPKIYIDDTYLDPVKVIQGHDGSITIAFNDYRDDLILELEMRIFNNIKVKYDPQIFDIHQYIPGYSRETLYSKQEVEQILSQFFFQWTANIPQDYTKQNNDLWNRLDPFTWNYRDNFLPDETDAPAFWRGIYKWTLDTDRPHTHPWECLGFSIKPKWWDTVYGPAPYTNNNYVLWEDIKTGTVREPGVPIRTRTNFAKTILEKGTPVDENGSLIDPYIIGFTQGFIKETPEGYYVFGDIGPVESAWRRSSYYPFAVIYSAILMQPNSVLGRTLDRSRIIKNKNDQLVYTETQLRIRLADLIIPSTSNSTDRVITSGIINWIVDYLTSETEQLYTQYKFDLKNLQMQMGSKLGGFTSKEKFRLILDSKNVASSGGVFIPDENYNVVANTSSPIKKINYSGVAITKYADGYEVRGYNVDSPYFIYYPYTLPGRTINVGGISESFLNWASGKYYASGKLIRSNGQYYRVKVSHQTGDTFDNAYYQRLPELPMTGGRDAELRKAFDTSTELFLSYGTKFSSVQEVVDFLQGYGRYLEEQGFVFDGFNTNLKNVDNWESAIKEFLFWTTQNWSEGAIISLSPAANNLVLKTSYAVVNDIKDNFFEYKVFRVDGQKLDDEFANTFRNENEFVLTPKNTNHGIYGATLYLIQKEHVLLLDNRTLFNDVIYDQEPGYRQERIKVIGYISSTWNGGYNAPGFIFDDARINVWDQWTDYNIGEIVKHKEYFYTASKFLPGVESFNSTDWILLEQAPEAKLLPNWEYKILQFGDFYSLDSDNFDAGQQKMAQHLIGYQKRQYLENIINDDVSQYKFYQGMIIEKGTQNVFNKLFDVLSADNQESLTFNEEWAIRVGNYGAVDSYKEIEFKLDESRFKLNPQPFELVNFIDPSKIDFVYRQIPTDIYIKPLGYSNDLWSTEGTKEFLRSAGYVRYEDVKLNLDSLNDILTEDISDFKEGDYVWCGFDTSLDYSDPLNPKPNHWNVYRFTKARFTVQTISYASNVLTIKTDLIPEVQPGDIIGIENATSIVGFYKVTSVSLREIKISTVIKNWQDPFEDSSKILVYEFKSARVNHIDNANNIIPKVIKTSELLWADNNGNSKYSVYKNQQVFAQNTLNTVSPAPNSQYGTSVSLSPTDSVAFVSTAESKVLVYAKASNTWVAASELLPRDSVSSLVNMNFGNYISFNPQGSFVAISAYTASDVNSSGLTNQGYVGIYYKTTSVSWDVDEIIVSPTPLANEKFGWKSVFTSRVLAVTALEDYTDPALSQYKLRGKVYLYEYVSDSPAGWYNGYNDVLVGSAPNDLFGYDLAISEDSEVLVISAPGYSNNRGAVYIYELTSAGYTRIQTLTGEAAGDQFGFSITLSNDAKTLIVGAPSSDTLNVNSGKVYVYSGNTFALQQTIFSNQKEEAEKFGRTVKLLDNDNLAIFSANGDSEIGTTFDIYSEILTGYVNNPESAVQETPTTIDNGTLRIVDIQIDAGRVDVFERLNNNFIFAETLFSSTSNDQSDLFGHSIAVNSNNIMIGAPNETGMYAKEGKVYAYSKPHQSSAWSVYHEEALRPNIENIKKAYIYSRKENQLTAYLDLVDPLQGKIAGPAEQELSYKTFFDPATYSLGTTGLNVDEGMQWTNLQVGTLWWDLTKAKFLENGAGDVVYRNTTWNRLYETASIDIYEWVESKYKPSEWDEISSSDRGSILGITGLTKYGDSAYSIKKNYDKISKTFKNIYYYWVKNPTVMPNHPNRKLSAYSVSRLISDPASEGYTCLALTGSNSFSLVNVERLISSSDHNLLVQYWNVNLNFVETNAHSQWKILSEHPNTVIPPEIETKWIHSLIGKDLNDRPVPDIKLQVKQRYGIAFRPRQSMFVNRIEALKQFIERVNNVLKLKLVADDYDLSDLLKFNDPPSAMSGTWDLKIDTESELRFVGTATLIQARLEPVIENGRIIGAYIANPGQGYINAPYITISNTGRGAVVKTVINQNGQVTGVTVVEKGEGYTNNTTFTIRPFTVLVSSDSNTFNKWSTYHWDVESLQWNRLKGQSYDVRNYWRYIDWYANGYSQFTQVNHIVDNTYELAVLESNIGDIVKVNNVGSGGWLLLQKYNNLTTIDYTLNFSVVGRNNGTIQFNSNLYDFSDIGYDSALFDTSIYDNLAETELRIIIDTIKNKLFVDELRVEYLKLFFASLRYVLHEQVFVDWIMKTSFVKATHNVGSLKQKVNYNSDNLENYEDYVKEVKPYRTQIREYVSSYSKLDLSQSSVTDFDLLPVINEGFAVSPLGIRLDGQGGLVYSDNELTTYPWKHWYDNVGFTIINIELVDGGSGYIDNPVIRIEGGYGAGAEAKAYIANGKVNRIQLIKPGTGYLKAPTIIVDGGLSVEGTAARAVAIIESEVVRANKIAIKFDRITRTYYVSEITETETFTGTGSKLQFLLKFSPDPTVGTNSVTVNNIEVLRDDYTLTTKKSTTKGFTSYSGILTLTTAPAAGDVVEITYKKNFHHLSAADRINFYYNPTTGMYGKDLAQLMTGIDYGGVNITGLGFNISGGWDSLPWFTDSWDGFDASFDDYIVVVGDSTYTFTLPYKPAAGEKINVYVNGTRIDDPYFNLYDGSTVQPNGRTIAPAGTVMSTITGDGVTDTFSLPNLTNTPQLDINTGDKIIFRRQTSDGSVAPLPGEYDTQLSGGDLIYSTATGLAPDDIILDGDKFVTPMTSHAPEEIVPGQITDTLAIKVFQLPTSASAKVSYLNYIADGITAEYSLPQIPANKPSVFVRLDGRVLAQGVDYTINWKLQNITLTSIPTAKKIVSVITLGVAGQEILDTNYFIADGSTTEYITNASYIENMGSVVLLNGEPVNHVVFRTDDGYESPGKVGLRFAEGFTSDDLITYLITANNNQKTSTTKMQEFIGDGSTKTFTLDNPVGVNEPHSNSVIVLINDLIQYSGSSEYFDLSNNNLIYPLSKAKVQAFRANPADFEVYLDGVKLTYGSQYYFDNSGVNVVLVDTIYKEGARLTVTNYTQAQYKVQNGQITVTVTPQPGWRIRVYTFYDHDVLEIERTLEFTQLEFLTNPSMYEFYTIKDLKGGQFKLPKMVASDDYVWIVKNNQMLAHSIDYYLDSDLKTIKLANPFTPSDVEIHAIILSDRVVNHSWAYMQFKDMLNRTHYKRISKVKTTRLARDLLQTDREIHVVDGSRLSPGNPALNLPGIIEINGERIEYYVKTGNVLSQLRRGTLGTGVPNLHRVRTNVIDIGHSETIPYVDRQVVETTVSDGSTNIIPLNYLPKKTAVTWYTETIPANNGRSDELEVFVGGYRLKKTSYKLFEESNGYPYSPEGDSQYEAEFSVNGTTNAVRITAEVPADTKIVVVKRQGSLWHPDGTDLTYHNGDIPRFIRNTEAIFSQYLVDKYQYVLATDDGTTLMTEGGEPLELD